MSGLVVRETKTEVLMWLVSRKPGERAFAWLRSEPRNEIESIDKLGEADREILTARVKAIDTSGKLETERMHRLELTPIAWAGNSKETAWRYSSLYFTLESNAGDDLIRRAAVRLDQIYHAYSHYLPARVEAGEPTRIVLARSLEEYQHLIRNAGGNLLNPAVYTASANRIDCGSDLQKLGADFEKARLDSQRLLDQLESQKAELARLYKKKIPEDLLKGLEDKREQVLSVRKKNEEAFDVYFRESTRRLMQRLYHEAFHAYLANFVYPASEAEVPVWLNEGLAEIFDSAFLDGDELRLGHADRERLRKSKLALAGGEFVPLAELVRSGPKPFLVKHATDKEDSDRYYLTSWCLAHYVMFAKKKVGTPALDDYVRALHKKSDPIDAFVTLAGEPLKDFEARFHTYVKELTPEGKPVKIPDKK